VGGYTFRLYHSTLARLDQLGLGLLAATAAERFNAWRVASSPRFARSGSWAAILAVAALITWTPQHAKLEFTALGVAFALLLLWVQRPAAREVVPGRAEALLAGSVGHLGKLSFGLYLLHPVCRRWTGRLMEAAGIQPGAVNAALFVACWLALTWALAWAVYAWVEEPTLRWARRHADRLLGVSRPAAAPLPSAATAP